METSLQKILKTLPSYQHLSSGELEDGIKTVLSDLERLSKVDGCIAAGVALDVLNAINSKENILKV